MIRVYLVRHGIAVEHGEQGQLGDEARWLTAKGRQRFRRLSRAFARLGEPLDFIFSSPLVRAVQTAEILAGSCRLAEIGILDELRPEGPVGKLLAEAGRRVKDDQAIALVGHDPQMTALVAALGDAKDVAIEFRKGSIVRIDVGALPSARPSSPRWWLKPRSRTLAKGLPIRKSKEEKALDKATKTGATEAQTKAAPKGSR